MKSIRPPRTLQIGVKEITLNNDGLNLNHSSNNLSYNIRIFIEAVYSSMCSKTIYFQRFVDIISPEMSM